MKIFPCISQWMLNVCKRIFYKYMLLVCMCRALKIKRRNPSHYCTCGISNFHCILIFLTSHVRLTNWYCFSYFKELALLCMYHYVCCTLIQLFLSNVHNQTTLTKLEKRGNIHLPSKVTTLYRATKSLKLTSSYGLFRRYLKNYNLSLFLCYYYTRLTTKFSRFFYRGLPVLCL